MLVEIAVPIECVGTVRCDFNGYYHVEVMGQEVDTDEDTYRKVIEARNRKRAECSIEKSVEVSDG
jgi:hypothetical protein